MISLRFLSLSLFVCVMVVGYNVATLAASPKPAVSNNSSVLAGMYLVNHTASMVNEKPYKVSDVLELVPYDKDALYVRTKLNFDNAHQCDFSSIAQREGDKYVSHSTVLGDYCVMEIILQKDSITLNDVNNKCRKMSCGARGSYEGISFPRSKKRPITYMKTLKNSVDYKNAVAQYKVLRKGIEKGVTPEWANAKNLLPMYLLAENKEGVQQALAQGADLNAVSEEGWAPAPAAGEARNIELTQMLIEHGLDINTVQTGKTMLTSAVIGSNEILPDKKKNYDYIKWLLDHGADSTIQDKFGKTALQTATQLGIQQDIIDLLSRVKK